MAEAGFVPSSLGKAVARYARWQWARRGAHQDRQRVPKRARDDRAAHLHHSAVLTRLHARG